MKVQICDFSELQGKKIKNIDFISCFSPEIYPKIDSVAIKTYCGHTYLMQSHHTDEFADREDIIIRLESQSSDIIHRLLNFTIEDASIEKNTLFFRNNANDCYVWQKHIKFNISHENAAVSIEWLCESSREPEDADTLNKSLDVVFFKLIN